MVWQKALPWAQGVLLPLAVLGQGPDVSNLDEWA